MVVPHVGGHAVPSGWRPPVDTRTVTFDVVPNASPRGVGASRALARRSLQTRITRTAVLSGALLLVYASWQLTRWGGTTHKALIGDSFFIPLNAAAIVGAMLAARRCRSEPRVRRSWQLLALALALYLFGSLATSYRPTTK